MQTAVKTWEVTVRDISRTKQVLKLSTLPVAPTPWDTGGTCLAHLQMSKHRGHRELKNSKKTNQTVLTIRKALTKTTNCAFRAKKWRGATKMFFFCRIALDRCPPPLLRTGAPHFPIRSGATGLATCAHFLLCPGVDTLKGGYRGWQGWLVIPSLRLIDWSLSALSAQ